MSNTIAIQGISKIYPGRKSRVRAIDNLSLTVEEGELLVLVGPSGCGKTTTLRCVAGLETPDSGTVSLGGRAVVDIERGINVPITKRDIGMVFQSYALWPHMSAYKNIDFPLKVRRAAERKKSVLDIARTVELTEELLAKRPGQMSGGQQQRVALARALVAETGVVLFDEPLSNLDALLREQLRVELKRMHKRIGFTGLYVTHDLAEAMVLGDRVAVMTDGKIEQLAPGPEVYRSPQTRNVARLMGMRELCILDASDADHSAQQRIDNAPPFGTAGPVHIYGHPEDLQIGTPDGYDRLTISEAQVDQVTYLGNGWETLVKVHDRRLRIIVPSSHEEPREGAWVSLSILWENLCAFDSNGVHVEAASQTQKASTIKIPAW